MYVKYVQVRLTAQFEEGQQFPAHLVVGPKKAKLALGPVKLHLQATIQLL